MRLCKDCDHKINYEELCKECKGIVNNRILKFIRKNEEKRELERKLKQKEVQNG